MAGSLRVEQLIFTRVEREFSLRSRDGYQVVWASSSLPPEVVGEIEERVRCFQMTSDRDGRLQFAGLRSAGFFAARTELVPVDRRIGDRLGRQTFLVRVGWVDDDRMAALQGDPFFLLDALPPCSALETLVEMYGQATGSAPDLRIKSEHLGRQRPDPTGQPSTASSDDVLVRSLAGFLVERREEERRGLFFLRGGIAAVESFLRKLLDVLPPSLRRECSFDTHVDGCFSEVARYRFLSGRAVPGAAPLRLLDLTTVSTAALPILGEMGATYVAWLERSRMVFSRREIRRQSATAYATVRALWGRGLETEGTGDLDREVCREILRHARPRLDRCLRERLRSRLGIRFGDSRVQRIADRLISHSSIELIRALSAEGNRSLENLATEGERTSTSRRRVKRWRVSFFPRLRCRRRQKTQAGKAKR